MTKTHRIATACFAGLLAMPVVACNGEDEGADVYLDTYDTYFASFSTDYDPAPTPAALAEESTVVTRATLVDVEDGRYFGESADAPDGVHLNLVFETADGERYYVQIPRPMDSDVDHLRTVMPIDASSVIFIRPNDDPIEDGWYNTRDDGNEWFFTTPQGWILDHPERGIVFPLEDQERDHGADDDHDHATPFPNQLEAEPTDLGSWLRAASG